MKVALVGAGRIGRMHAGLLRDRPEVSELLVADAEPERARTVAAEVDGTFVASVDEAVGRAEALAIAASTGAHAGLIRAGADRGIPVFCEKPLAMTLEESRDVVEHVERAGIQLQLGFQRRFDAGYRAARALIEQGALGRVYIVRLASHDSVLPDEAFIPTSGGPFIDMSIHDLDAARFLTGAEIEEVYADGSVRGFEMFARHGDYDTTVATLRLSDGTLGVLTMGRHDPLGYDVRAEIFGSQDSIAVGLGPRTPMRSVEPDVPPPAGPAWPHFPGRFEDAYRAEIAEFMRVIRGEIASPCTGRDGLEALRAALAATRSLREHRPVRVAEVV
ncbi:MAG: hypothetical protein A2X23_09785 [Chloroflexi bacterium GWC2_73_18]|nr:MAG: hypothetical protein A2X23_09785 [Chloroflexi bacterium GWC2_73_18]